MKSQQEKAQAFKELHERDGAFVIPNPWDVGTAKLLQRLGFEALATTSAGLAFSLGKKDGRGQISREQVLENARAMNDAVMLPMTADLENGYSDTIEGLGDTIRLAAEAGMVGASIEDSVGQPGATVLAVDAAVDRVRSAVEAARELDFPFLITARAENYVFGRKDIGDTISRLRAFERAGADVLYAPGLSTPEEVEQVVKALEKPVNVLMGSGLDLSVAQLQEIGVKRISIGSSFSRAALGAFLDAAREVKEQGTFGFGDKAISYKDIQKLI